MLVVILLLAMLASLTYGWVDLELDSDGDGLKWDKNILWIFPFWIYSRDHVDDFDDDNDGILDIHDEDDDGDGIVDLEVGMNALLNNPND